MLLLTLFSFSTYHFIKDSTVSSSSSVDSINSKNPVPEVFGFHLSKKKHSVKSDVPISAYSQKCLPEFIEGVPTGISSSNSLSSSRISSSRISSSFPDSVVSSVLCFFFFLGCFLSFCFGSSLICSLVSASVSPSIVSSVSASVSPWLFPQFLLRFFLGCFPQFLLRFLPRLLLLDSSSVSFLVDSSIWVLVGETDANETIAF